MDERVPHRFEPLIAARTGLHLRLHERETLRELLAERMIALHLRHEEQYHLLLQGDTSVADSEWEQLTARLTNHESYFFRDKGQMALLRERILPELIAQNQAQRTLRLWSAGCSTGEEAYSLAIIVDELLSQQGAAARAGWKIVILGTDIDRLALQKAHRGVYGAWSFRTVEPALQQRYFHRQEGGWRVAESSRSLVSFASCNLVADTFPNTATGLHDMDLILCRNVFIYFEREAVSTVLSKFARTLRDGGYLMTGHAETYGRLVEPLQARLFPESVLYQRTHAAESGINAPTASGAAPARERGRNVATRDSRPSSEWRPSAPSHIPAPVSAYVPLPAASTALAFATPEPVPVPGRDIAPIPMQEEPAITLNRALLEDAYAAANQGHYEEAVRCCERLITEFPFAYAPYALLASIAQEQGRTDDAKILLKKVLYLAPAMPSAYLELGAIYRSEGDRARAHKMYLTALELLRQLPPEVVPGDAEGPTAQEWIQHIEQISVEGG